MATQAQINVGAGDNALRVTLALPAAGGNATTAALNLETSAPNSNAWRMGRFAIVCPAVPGNNSTSGITVTMNCAGPNLTAGSIAPLPIVAGAYAAPQTSQVTTISPVAVSGSPAQTAFQTAAFDSTGSTFQFYEWVVAVDASCTTAGEVLEIVWIKDSE